MPQLLKTMMRVALGALAVDGAPSGIAICGGLALGRGRFRAGICPVLCDGDGDCIDREEDGRVVV